MDCEGFDEVALDLVYDDGPSSQTLDEARRHADGCGRCAASLASLHQARGAVELAPLPVPPGLERSILSEIDRRREAHEATWWGRIDRLISFLGAYAMRPQTATGALLVLMTGLSLVLLRVRPAERGSVRITEDGVPASEPARVAAPAASAVALAPARAAEPQPPRAEDKAPSRDDRPRDRDPSREAEVAAPSPTALATATAPAAAPAAPATTTGKADSAADPPQEAAYAAAMEHYKARRYGDAMRAFDIVANGGGSNGALASLYAARSARYSSGCTSAVPRFDAIATRQVGSVAAEATWEAAVCYRELGQVERARQLFGTLRRVAGYRDRVEKELAAIEQRPSADAAPGGARPGAAAAPKAAASRLRGGGARGRALRVGVVATGVVRARAARPRALRSGGCGRASPPC